MKTKLFHWVNGDCDFGLQNVVLLSDAEAERDKACKAGYYQGVAGLPYEREMIRADERERIVRELQTVLNSVPANLENISGMRCAMEIIKSRPERDHGEQCGYTCEAHKPKERKERKPLELFSSVDFDPSNFLVTVKLNAIVDALNELRSSRGKD